MSWLGRILGIKPNDWMAVWHESGVCDVSYPWGDTYPVTCHIFIQYSASRNKYRVLSSDHGRHTGAYSHAIDKIIELNNTLKNE